MKNKDLIVDYLNEIIPDPKCELNYNKDYELLIATMLSAQTKDKRVNEATAILFDKYNNLESLSKADINDIKSIIRPLGSYNKKAYNVIAIADALKDINMVPNDRKLLESLPGVGRKTVNVVLSILYNEPYIAVDTHVKRVSNRLRISKSADVLKIEKDIYKYFKGENFNRLHHQLVLFGRYYCKAINPECYNCKLKDICKKNSI